MFDGFLYIDGISGESTDETYNGWMEIQDFDFGVSQTVSRSASSVGGACGERVDFSEFSFTKPVDKATPKLALFCAAGTHIDSIILALNRPGGDRVRFMQYEFTNCMISSLYTSACGDFPEDEISFVYSEIKWCYTCQSRHGGWAAGNIISGWNLEKNCKV